MGSQPLNDWVIPYTRLATIEINDEVYETLQLPEGEPPQALKQELAVSLYVRDALSFGKTRALAELSMRAVHELLDERAIARHSSEVELVEDLEYAAQRAHPAFTPSRRLRRRFLEAPRHRRRYRHRRLQTPLRTAGRVTPARADR